MSITREEIRELAEFQGEIRRGAYARPYQDLLGSSLESRLLRRALVSTGVDQREEIVSAVVCDGFSSNASVDALQRHLDTRQ